MITVSLQPFAFRKIVVFLAALLWLTATVLFADPVLMNARAEGLARHRNEQSSMTLAVARSAAPITHSAATHRMLEQTKIAPAEGPSIRSTSFDRLDTWSEFARQPFTADAELTFWSLSLVR